MEKNQGNIAQTEVFTPSPEREAKLEARRTRRLVRTGYTVKDVAEKLSILPKQVRRNIRRGNLAAVKVGVPYFVSRSNFNAFVKARAS